jgi:hypothetical protein
LNKPELFELDYDVFCPLKVAARSAGIQIFRANTAIADLLTYPSLVQHLGEDPDELGFGHGGPGVILLGGHEWCRGLFATALDIAANVAAPI